MWNVLRNVPTTLESNVHALRDYVFVGDIAAFIVRQLQAGPAEQLNLHYLVSGKPSSIFEIVNRVKRLVGRSLLMQFSDQTRNDADITFSSTLLPAGWFPQSLDQGLREVLRINTNEYRQLAAIEARN